MLAPLFDLPKYPVIGFPPVPFEPREKVPAIASFVGSRPAAWVEDIVTPEARAWAAARRVPTLLVAVDSRAGLTRRHVDRLLLWAASL